MKLRKASDMIHVFPLKRVSFNKKQPTQDMFGGIFARKV